MKRISVILVSSGIIFAIYFFNTTSQKFVFEEGSSVARTAKEVNYFDKSQTAAKTNVENSRSVATKSSESSNQRVENQSRPEPITIDFEKIRYPASERFKKLKNFYVIKKEDYVPGDFEVYEKRAAFYIVRSDFPVGSSNLSVVTVNGSKYLGIVTGVLKVELDDYSQRDEILAGHNYTITSEFAHLNRVFYQLDGLEAAKAAYSYIKDKVPYAELEILQYERRER